jgi:hypothetical protein
MFGWGGLDGQSRFENCSNPSPTSSNPSPTANPCQPGASGSAAGERGGSLWEPTGIAADANGHVYVDNGGGLLAAGRRPAGLGAEKIVVATTMRSARHP